MFQSLILSAEWFFQECGPAFVRSESVPFFVDQLAKFIETELRNEEFYVIFSQ